MLLIAGISVWAVVATSVPGLTGSFSSPFFIAASLVLFASTAACAWERSREARRWRGSLAKRRLRYSPLSVGEAASRLESLGLKVTAEGESVVARRGGIVLSSWASPLFHWSLAAGIALAVAGSLLGASEGLVLGEGEPRRLVMSGQSITLTLAEVRPDLVVDGISRGQAPRLAVFTDGRNSEGWSYPNHPMRTSGFTIHGIDSGPSVRLRFAAPEGSTIETDVPLVASGVETFSAGVAVVGGPTLRIEQRPRRSIAIESQVSSSDGTITVLAEGESEVVAPGLTASFVRAGTWASVRVVKDPTMPWLAGAGVVACLAAAVALLFPPRAVRIEPAEMGCTFRIASARIDPAFGRRVRETLGEDEASA